MSFDAVSYIIGKKDGEGNVFLEDGEEYTFTDAENDGNVVIAKKEDE